MAANPTPRPTMRASHAAWMPYQVGQAAKTAEAEAKAAALLQQAGVTPVTPAGE